MRRAGGGDHDIHFGKHGHEARVIDRRALEQRGHLGGAFRRAVGDEDVGSAGAAQVAGGQLRHLARAYQHDSAVFK